MTEAGDAREVVVERWIQAPPETVFSYFADPERWLLWQGVDATIEAHAGGAFRMNVRGDGWASGRFLEVVPPERLVFTWGWEGQDGVPPGSSTVEVELRLDGDGTRVTLRHRGLPDDDAAQQHRDGWHHYLDRLVITAAGGDAGPDPTTVGAGNDQGGRS